MNGIVGKIQERLRKIFFWHESGKSSAEFVPEPTHDHALVLNVAQPRRVPRLRQLRYAGRVLTRKEQRTLGVAALIFVVALLAVLWSIAKDHVLTVPASGGSIVEAIVGAPKYPNPLYSATNDPDADLVALVYAGLFRRVDGSTVVPDLVERFEWSPDAKRLTLTLRSDARFHDGMPLTSDDVIFTLNAAKDPAWRSTHAGAFRGMKVERTDDRTVVVVLERPDVTVLDTLTLGVLPEHVWRDVPAGSAPLADANVRPIGAGPFRVRSYRRDKNGSILAYTLDRNSRYHGLKPFLDQIELRYFADRDQAEEALRGGQVDAVAFVPGPVMKSLGTHERLTASTLELPQETIVFMNMNDGTLKDAKVRQALSLVVERNDVVNAQADIATAVSGPFPFAPFVAATTTPEERLDQARALLTQAGWAKPDNGDIRIKVAPPKPKPTTPPKPKAGAATPVAATTTAAVLSTPSSTLFTLTLEVPDVPDLVAVADVLQRRWSLLGAKVDVKVEDPDTLAHRVTTDRNAQILMWNVLLSPSQDQYPIWWSGQTTGHGLNLSNLTDRNVDDAIEATRVVTTTSGLLQARDHLTTTILARFPAIFLTRPAYGYVHNKRLHGMTPRLQLGRPSDRFNDIGNWYVNSGWRWR